MLTDVERQILYNQKLIILMLQCPSLIHGDIAQQAINIAMERTDILLKEDQSNG